MLFQGALLKTILGIPLGLFYVSPHQTKVFGNKKPKFFKGLGFLYVEPSAKTNYSPSRRSTGVWGVDASVSVAGSGFRYALLAGEHRAKFQVGAIRVAGFYSLAGGLAAFLNARCWGVFRATDPIRDCPARYESQAR